MVLQQLDAHSQVLRNLDKELSDIKQAVGISKAEVQMWKVSTEQSIGLLEKKMDNVLYEDTGVTQKVNILQRDLEVEDKASTKHKAVWAVYGAIIVFLINVGLQVVHMLFFK